MGKPNKKKGPKTLIDPDAGKKPKTELHEDWREMRPAWRVSLLELHTPFGWKQLDLVTASAVRQRLASYESMKWREILFEYRSHLVKPTDLCKDAQEHLVAIQQDDVDALVSLGITQMGRVYGILEHNILKLLWWDPEHEVWPMGKPNT